MNTDVSGYLIGWKVDRKYCLLDVLERKLNAGARTQDSYKQEQETWLCLKIFIFFMGLNIQKYIVKAQL